MALTIDVGTVQINQMAPNPALWQMPVIGGYPQINLGTAAANTVSAMGAPGSSDWNTGAAPGWLGIDPQQGAIAAASQNRPIASYVMPPVTPTSATVSTPVAPSTPPIASQSQFQRLPVGGVPLERNTQ
jgi:hypothetical protein